MTHLNRFRLMGLIAAGGVAGFTLTSTVQAAAVVNTTVNIAPDTGAVHDPYDPATDVSAFGPALAASGSDLVEGLTAAVTYTGGSGSTTTEGSAGEPAWTDGSLATVYAEAGPGGDATDHAAYGIVTATVGGVDIDTFVTFDLGGLFNLSQVDVFTGWNDSGRDNSSFNLLASADGVTYNNIASFLKGQDDTGAIGEPVTNRHSVVDDGAADIASAVQFVQLHFTDADNGYAGLVEVDVFGQPVPEPGSMALLALGGALAIRRRR